MILIPSFLSPFLIYSLMSWSAFTLSGSLFKILRDVSAQATDAGVMLAQKMYGLDVCFTNSTTRFDAAI